MATFNLIEEPWLPCTTRAGPALLGIRETLLNAHEIRELIDPSPLVTVALHRFLFSILHRVYGPEDGGAWRALHERGKWESAQLEAYLDQWHDRFDLFSPTYPFFQAADLAVPPDKNDAYTIVLQISPSNRTLFSHVDGRNPPSLSPAEAARALIAIQPFHRSGTTGSKHGRGPAMCGAGPLAGAAVCLLTGTSLFETLLLNMVRYSADPEEGLPFPARNDRPVWERDEPPDDVQRVPDGYLDWLTWVSWIVRLAPDEVDGRLVVRRAQIVAGNRLPPNELEATFETMVAYRKNEKLGFLPVSMRAERAVWRDSAALFQSADATSSPRTLQEISQRVRERALPRRAAHPLAVYGVLFEKANALFWRTERVPLPLAYLDDRALYAKLRTALELGEAVGFAVRSATRVLAALVLGIDLDGKLNGAKQEALNHRAASMGAERRYWAWLEPHFSRFLVEQVRIGDEALLEWGEEVIGAAHRAYGEVAQGLGTGGDALRVEVEGRAQLRRLLAKARKDHPYGDTLREEAS